MGIPPDSASKFFLHFKIVHGAFIAFAFDDAQDVRVFLRLLPQAVVIAADLVLFLGADPQMAALLRKLSTEMEYLQAEQEATRALAQIKSILAMPKPYRSIAELPELIQKVQSVYAQLLDVKKQDVYAEIHAAMGEIHQTADIDQRAIVDRADSALKAKETAASEATTLTQLDAMKIQISNIRQQYLKALVVVEKPHVDTVTANRGSICYTVKLETEADVDRYLAEIKEKLMQMLDGHDVLHII